MGDADKPASCIFGEITKRITAFIIFTKVHGHKYSSFYLFDELFCPFHNREILTWKEQRPDIHYIFSKDILNSHRAQAEDAIYIKKGETYEDETLRIDAFGSTDVGSCTIPWLCSASEESL